MYEFVKTIYSWGIDIDSYLKLGTITQQEYEEITNGGEYRDTETS